MRVLSRIRKKPTRARLESNRWLRAQCHDVEGSVLSIGSGTDSDLEGGRYRDYFVGAASYTTSEIDRQFSADLVIDVRSMPEIGDETYDCVFCSGVLEHVDDWQAGLREITRILRRGGVLLLGLPFRQAMHGAPRDFWRWTECGIRYALEKEYEILELGAIDTEVTDFPVTYWLKAKKFSADAASPAGS